MKFTQTLFLFSLTLTLFSACTPDSSTTPTSPSSLPDLSVSNVYLGMQGVPTDWTECVPDYGPFEIRALIRNLGGASAYNISVFESSTGTDLTIGEMKAGQGMELFFPMASPSTTYNVVVDPQNTIQESNEGNNTFSYLAITSTPPVLCASPSTPLPNLSTPIPSSGSGSAVLSQSVLLNSAYRSPNKLSFLMPIPTPFADCAASSDCKGPQKLNKKAVLLGDG